MIQILVRGTEVDKTELAKMLVDIETMYPNINIAINGTESQAKEYYRVKMERAKISAALDALVEKIEYLFSNLENASDSQLEDIKQIRNIMDILYLKVLKEQFKRA